MRVARALATIKRRAAVVNPHWRPGLDAELVAAIGDAARRIEVGELDASFPVDVYQTGSGHVDEHERQRGSPPWASQALGRPVHPNDHVNASQSSNDVVPAAIRLAFIAALAQHTHPCPRTLVGALRDLSERTMGRQGRTHPPDGRHAGDGRPGGRRLGGLARAALGRSVADLATLGELPLGGTAVGTGINAPGGFAGEVDRADRRRDGVRPAHDRTRWSTRVVRVPSPRHRAGCVVSPWPSRRSPTTSACSPAARRRASANCSSRSCRPARRSCRQGQPGALRVGQPGSGCGGNDVTVGYAASQGILELNTYLPVIADALLESATLLGNVATVFAERCVAGIEVDEQRTRYAERTSALATALNPIIGYERAAAIVKEAQASGRSIVDVVVAEGVLPADEARRVLDPLRAAGLGCRRTGRLGRSARITGSWRGGS